MNILTLLIVSWEKISNFVFSSSSINIFKTPSLSPFLIGVSIGPLYSITDKPINNIESNGSDFIEIKKPLLSKAKKNLDHFSKLN